MGKDHDVFRDVKESPVGRDIAKFLKQRDNIIRLETACLLRHPAIAGVAPALEQEFGDKLNVDRVRQAVGAIIRDVLEEKGYRLAGKNLRVCSSSLFRRGCRYEKH